MNIYEKHAVSLARLQVRLGDACPVVQWADLDFKVVPGSVLRRAELGGGGMTLDADFVFEALVETWRERRPEITDAKAMKDALLRTPIGYLGDEYQVATVKIRPGGLEVQVECVALGQRA